MDKQNWMIHALFTRQQHDECLALINESLRSARGLNEYALVVKGCILRSRGLVGQALPLFQAAACLNPRSVVNLKEIGRCLFLLGKYSAALTVVKAAEAIAPEDWELSHARGVILTQLREPEAAVDAFANAISVCRQERTCVALAQLHMAQKNTASAAEVLEDALDAFPSSPELATQAGLLSLRLGRTDAALGHLKAALAVSPRSAAAVFAMASMAQQRGELDSALQYYRIAALSMPSCHQLWNNVGALFFARKRHIAAVACLKRALFLDPFSRLTHTNLGLAFLSIDQPASAFQHFSVCLALSPGTLTSGALMNLGMCLAQLQDCDNAVNAVGKVGFIFYSMRAQAPAYALTHRTLRPSAHTYAWS